MKMKFIGHLSSSCLDRRIFIHFVSNTCSSKGPSAQREGMYQRIGTAPLKQ